MTTLIDHIQAQKNKMQGIVQAMVDDSLELVFTSTNVFAIAPPKLDTAELPAFYPLTGSAQFSESDIGEKYERVTRLYRLQVPVIPIAQGNPNTRETLCVPLLQRVVREFQAYPSLDNCSWVEANGVTVLSDSGIVVLPEWGAKFIGFEVRLQVVYYDEREFGSGE